MTFLASEPRATRRKDRCAAKPITGGTAEYS